MKSKSMLVPIQIRHGRSGCDDWNFCFHDSMHALFRYYLRESGFNWTECQSLQLKAGIALESRKGGLFLDSKCELVNVLLVKRGKSVIEVDCTFGIETERYRCSTNNDSSEFHYGE